MTENKGDLISRSALIKWIDDSVSQYGNTYSTNMLNMWGLFKDYLINNAPTVTPKLPTEVKKALEVLKAMKQGKWIPVSEKLPPNYVLCMFCTVDGDIFYGFRNSENLWREKGSTENISNVVAWQELPEPYKPGGAS